MIIKSMTSMQDSGIMEAMISRETTTYTVYDYFAHMLLTSSSSNRRRSTSSSNISSESDSYFRRRQKRHDNADVMDPYCRFVMVKWCMSLIRFCNYENRERMTASIMSNADRFVSTKEGSYVLYDRERYQLVVMASFYIQAKIQQLKALNPSSVAKLSRGKFTKDDVERMEFEILTALKWHVNPPTSIDFVYELLKKFFNDHINDSDSEDFTMTKTKIIELVNYQIGEAICDYELSCLCRPSHVAFAALLNSLESLRSDDDLVLLQRLNDIDNYSCGDDDQIIRNIRTALLNAVSSSSSKQSGDSHHNQAISTLLSQRISSQNNEDHNIRQIITTAYTPNNNSTSKTTPNITSCTYIHSSPRSVIKKIL
mmetsp:Transcript_14234/g.15451  ORF Transcript_14234/g.15451 Transcript_14234/m.15451 type:complete len:369 (+) Transcript_14234:169-1275(+)